MGDIKTMLAEAEQTLAKLRRHEKQVATVIVTAGAVQQEMAAVHGRQNALNAEIDGLQIRLSEVEQSLTERIEAVADRAERVDKCLRKLIDIHQCGFWRQLFARFEWPKDFVQ
jgi:regulator of replication initiation timing